MSSSRGTGGGGMGAERDDRLSLFSVWELETGSGVGQDA